jgi:glucose/arabinose dehydrogenase
MITRKASLVVLMGSVALVGAVATVSAADAAKGPPPPPKAVSGHPVTVVARGVPTPTTFAFGGGRIFVAGFGDEQHPKVTGGVYVLKGGRPVKIPGSPPHVFGLAYSGGTLYVSGGARGGGIYAWSGWNGTRFAKSRVVVGPRKGFTSFNGIAVGPNGKLYAGVSLGDKKTDDYSKGSTLYANDVVSVDPGSGRISVVASGMRQPWQPVFVTGHAGPLISDLGQENLGKKRPIDRIVEARQGADFGFPSCPAKPTTCSRYDKPVAVFPAHSSPMGLGELGGKLYVALFGGTGKGPEVVSMPLSGGKYAPTLVGFVAPVVALAAHAGKLYVGDLTGRIYSVTP